VRWYGVRVWAATRIWSTSELARYLPGSIWQIVGRVYLAKPYGVRGSVVTTSQIMELALFLLANLMVAVAALAFFLKKLRGDALMWVIIALVLVPLLSLALHPRIFYGITDRVLTKLGKPIIQSRLRW
jgi:glycosyltransferase 2 family protein